MQLHGVFEILPRHVLQRTNFDNAGVVDQNINLAKAIDDLTNRGFNLCGIEQVALNGQDHTAVCGEISLCTAQFIRIARDERNASSLRTNVSRQHKPESARTPCDDSHFAAECITRGANNASGYPSAEKQRTCGKQA